MGWRNGGEGWWRGFVGRRGGRSEVELSGGGDVFCWVLAAEMLMGDSMLMFLINQHPRQRMELLQLARVQVPPLE